MAYLWQISVASFRSKTRISGILLGHAPVRNRKPDKSRTAFLRLIVSYFTPPLSNAPVELIINKVHFNLTTDKNGMFELFLDHPLSEAPEINILYKGTPLKREQHYPLFFAYGHEKIGVISDIDDTLLLSYSASNTKRIGTLFFVPPQKRKVILFTKQLIEYLHEEKAEIHYVSKSENNLFDIISHFIRHNGLPEGLLLLTPYRTAGSILHQKRLRNFKLDNIDFIVRNSEGKKFVLFGDDTQKDMDIYATIAQRFPGRIAMIYIRMTTSALNKKKTKKWRKLKEVFPDTVLFTENTNIADEKERLRKTVKSLIEN